MARARRGGAGATFVLRLGHLDDRARQRGGGATPRCIRAERVDADDGEAAGEHARYLRGVLHDPVVVHVEGGGVAARGECLPLRGSGRGACVVGDIVVPVWEGHEREDEIASAHLQLADAEADVRRGAIGERSVECTLHRALLDQHCSRRHRMTARTRGRDEEKRRSRARVPVAWGPAAVVVCSLDSASRVQAAQS